MLMIFFEIKEIVYHKKFVLQAKQLIPHTTVTFTATA
jgi:hypothetical protein